MAEQRKSDQRQVCHDRWDFVRGHEASIVDKAISGGLIASHGGPAAEYGRGAPGTCSDLATYDCCETQLKFFNSLALPIFQTCFNVLSLLLSVRPFGAHCT